MKHLEEDLLAVFRRIEETAKEMVNRFDYMKIRIFCFKIDKCSKYDRQETKILI
jgi:hypothetical protein